MARGERREAKGEGRWTRSGGRRSSFFQCVLVEMSVSGGRRQGSGLGVRWLAGALRSADLSAGKNRYMRHHGIDASML